MPKLSCEYHVVDVKMYYTSVFTKWTLPLQITTFVKSVKLGFTHYQVTTLVKFENVWVRMSDRDIITHPHITLEEISVQNN